MWEGRTLVEKRGVFMFMPYFFSEKHDTLTVVYGGVGIGASLLILCFFGVGAIMFFCGGTLPPSVNLEAGNIAGIAASMGIAIAIILFRTAITIDRSTGVITKRWGSILVFRRKEFSLDDYISVVVTRKQKTYGSSGGTVTVYDVNLHGTHKSLRLKRVHLSLLPPRFKLKPHAEKLKARIDAFLGF